MQHSPFGCVRVVDYNHVNEPMLFVHQESSVGIVPVLQVRGERECDLGGRAFGGFDETKDDLMIDQSGKCQYVCDSVLGQMGQMGTARSLLRGRGRVNQFSSYCAMRSYTSSSSTSSTNSAMR